MNERDLINLINRAKIIAQNNSPFDTGNLRFNAITAQRLGNGGRVRINGRDAYYAQFLQEGRGYSNKHAGFVDLIRSEIESMILNYFTKSIRGRGRYRLKNATQEDMRLNAREAQLQRSRTRFDKDVIYR